MDKMREQFVDEIKRLKNAIENTSSQYLKRDYKKAIFKMEKELKDYDRFHNNQKS